MDALKPEAFISHFSFKQSLDAILEILGNNSSGGGRGFFTGLSHELEHDEINNWIDEKNKNKDVFIECCYDGMQIKL